MTAKQRLDSAGVPPISDAPVLSIAGAGFKAAWLYVLQAVCELRAPK
jgi:hypothetical protein